MTEQRRLAAIVCADVAGYSRMMGQDESGTLAALRAARREVVDPKIAAHHGRIVKTTGDGLLMEFSSVVDAVRCVVQVQTAMAERDAGVPQERRITFRVGVNLGDIIIEGDDIFGDGVNIAARLQEIAAPGGVCVSSRVHDDVRDRLDVVFTDGGEPQLKNIARPIRTWRWSPAGLLAPEPVVAETPPPLPDKPSIAVLPFTNMSGDPEQGYFADGVAEDITTALSRFPTLFVTARNSSFAYKGKLVDLRQVGRELGVRYILEGSVRRAGNRLRVTGQLVEAATGSHVWADQYDGNLDDIFALQDRITEAVAGAMAPTLQRAEVERARRNPPRSFDAYDLWLRGLPFFHAMTPESNARALNLFEQALQVDPTFVPALRTASGTWGMRRLQGWAGPEAIEHSMDYALRALRQEPDNADNLAFVAYVTIYSRGDGLTLVSLEEIAGMASRAITLNPNSVNALSRCGWAHVYTGPPDTAIAYLERALRLGPKDLWTWATWGYLARAYVQVGRDQDAIVAARTSLQQLPDLVLAWTGLTGALALAGRIDEARDAASRLMELQPSFRLGERRTFWERINPATNRRLLDGLRLASLPE